MKNVKTNLRFSPRAEAVTPFLAMEVFERAKELEAAGRDIVYLCVGEPDFPSPAVACEAAIRAIGLGVRRMPQGAFYVLADARSIHPDSLKLAMEILEATGVAVTPGIDFGEGAQGYLRFSYANSTENIDKAMDRLQEYLPARK